MRLRSLALSLAAVLAGAALSAAPGAEAAVYWGSGGFIGAANLDGSVFVDGVPYRASNVPEIGNVCGLTVSNGNLYWADSSRGTIGRMQLPASPTGYADFVSETVSIDEAFVSGLVSPCGVAVDGAHVYWTSMDGRTIGRANLDGSNPERTFISGVSSPCGVAVDGAHIYWGSFQGNSIGRASLDGNAVDETFVEGAEGHPCGIAVDGGHLYWSNWDGSTIGRAGIDGGPAENDFITGLENPCGVAVDGSHVYWTNWDARDPVGRANLDGSAVDKSLVSTEFYLASCGVALDSKVFQPPPPPQSYPFFLGKAKRDEKRGIAYVNVKVPSAGNGSLNVVSHGLRWELLGPPATEGGYLVYQLKVWPGRGKAAKKIRTALARKGRASVVLSVAYQEPGKRAYLASRPLTLIRRGAGRRR
jgi:hypothetical protein